MDDFRLKQLGIMLEDEDVSAWLDKLLSCIVAVGTHEYIDIELDIDRYMDGWMDR